MVVIKIKNQNRSESYYLGVMDTGVSTVLKPTEARLFTNPSKAKLEMLKLILDFKIPKRNLSIEPYNGEI